jgi:hypothetical protein
MLCDRFLDSSFAYQARGRELGDDFIRQINAPAMEIVPDRTLLFVGDREKVLARLRSNDNLDRMEVEKDEFFIRVYDAFEDLHQIPYTQKDRSGHGLVADWDGFMAALREIGYAGTLNFETYASLNGVPDELISAMLRLTAAIGEYFAKKITE